MSGELERLAAQAEMMPALRTHGGLVLSREAKQMQSRIRQEIANGVVDKARIAIKTDIALDVMDGLCEVDAYRRMKANGDETLNSLLAEAELAYAHTLSRIQRG